MDNKIAFVCEQFKIAPELLFSKSRLREFTDARFLLYALWYEGNLNGTKKALKQRYNHNISSAGIKYGVSRARKFHSHLISIYQRDELKKNLISI